VKSSISRQNIYLITLSTVLFIFVLLFSFSVLIPNGKEYRKQRAELLNESAEVQKYEDFNDETLDRLKKLQSENRHIITAFKTPFDPERFEKQYKSYFNSLSVTPKVKVGTAEDEFTVYEVNTTSKINSPIVFYDFLDAVNKSDWIIGINFPINFKRESEMISSSFTMKVYSFESNSTK
jgi:hypothetical protein